MSTWYTILIFPVNFLNFMKLYKFFLVKLLLTRYWTYHKIKYHYFMLDFCYFVQLLLLLFLYFMPNNITLFQILFSVRYKCFMDLF